MIYSKCRKITDCSIYSSLAGQKSYITVININDEVESVNLDSVFTSISTQLQYVVVNNKSSRRKK